MFKAIRSLAHLLPILTFLVMTPASSEAAKLSEDLYSFQVLVGGDLITLPCTYEQMINDGWKYDGDEDELLRPEQCAVSSSWEKNGVLLSGEMVNTSWDVLPVEACALAAVELNASAVKAQLPGGVKVGVSGMLDVANAYGLPSSDYENCDTVQYTYHLDYNQEAVFTFSASAGVLQSVSLRNVIMSAAPDPAALCLGSASGSSYSAPDSLGENPLSFRVSFGDALYRLPAPVSEFVKNGWQLYDGADGVVKAYGSGQLTLSLSGKRWVTWVYNDSDKAALAGNCLVTAIVSDASRGDVPLVLPGGVANGMTEEEALKAYVDLNDKVSSSGSVRRHVFSDGQDKIVISVAMDTGLVSRVEVTNTP
jgi:hypothetical protein